MVIQAQIYHLPDKTCAVMQNQQDLVSGFQALLHITFPQEGNSILQPSALPLPAGPKISQTDSRMSISQWQNSRSPTFMHAIH